MILSDTRTIRDADRCMIEDHHYPGILLMEEAGKQATQAILDDFPDQLDFLVLAGPGNNGGDGFVIARLLHLVGKRVKVLTPKPEAELPQEGDAAIMRTILRELPVPMEAYQPGMISAYQNQNILLIDALLGTRIRSTVRGAIAEMIAEAIETKLSCVAIDLPSGLNADNGTCINSVIPAAFTYTFQLPKLCHYVTPASEYCGVIRVLDIGIWPSVLEQLSSPNTLVDEPWVSKQWKPRETSSHKGSHGHLLIVAGSKNMAGAAILATKTALQGGAGLVTVACPESVRTPLLSACPEAMCMSFGDSQRGCFDSGDVSGVLNAVEGKTAVLIGPGMGMKDSTIAFTIELLAGMQQYYPNCPTVLDADGLNHLAERTRLTSENLILTPHPGEMRRLLHQINNLDVQQERLDAALACAKIYQATVVLKGAGTIVATPEEEVYVNTSGNPALAAGGTGDVLAGLIGALLAQEYSKEIAAAMGVWLHGKAADLWIEDHPAEALTAGILADRISASFPQAT